ncbi:hypothetical protein N7495_006257 [Penicillium taxi]|uniref:uncharacterized protein n=1 Tax=Penicillium taxi TaxID=168475 RepID=UPI002544D7D8|nr:uncharacterized protein N7495_006257 [Penicillium taxi]KAJ5894566.1 hypothetical protein N7495_006257 [Penicillium taxi]
MSSPPPYQNVANPLKRHSISSNASQPGKKARMHPLRQASFADSLDIERSFGGTSDAGSVTGSFTGSLGGTSADGVFSRNKKRGRKNKIDKDCDDAMSTRATDTPRPGSPDGGGSIRAGMGGAGAGGADEADDDDDYGDLGRDEGTTDTEAEKKNLAILVDAFNPMQSERYDLFKRAKLRKESLRRIVNHALSQSVPASVVTTVNGFTKVYAGEMIEKARTVQAEWAQAFDDSSRAAFDAQEAARSVKEEGSSSQLTQRVFRPPPNPHRGQLLPSHLREGLRRTKRDGEGGGVGYSGLSNDNLAVKGSVTWSSGTIGGRRLFR